jgi:tetratricopeptide (TPR) repeat protein
MRRRLLFVLPLAILVILSVPILGLTSRSGLCHAIGHVRLDAFVTGCRATAALDAGVQARGQGRLREALLHFRAAVQQDATFSGAHLARAEAAEILGEFDEALEAYRTAAGLAYFSDAELRFGSMADRVGHTDAALLALEDGQGSVLEHASAGALAGGAALWQCATHSLQNLSAPYRCLGFTVYTVRAVFRASRETIPQHRFRILIEAGRHGAAVELARTRGWMHENVEYCKMRDVALAAETLSLLAMLTQPDRADCVVNHGLRLADDGLTRLARVVLVDRMTTSANPKVRERAKYILRYRLPAHDVAKVAESLNVTGYRLQYHYKNAPEALAVYGKAIAADPRFSWPYHNIGRVYLEQHKDAEALQWTAQALEVNPDHWRALRSLGAAYHGLGRYGEALAAFSRAVEIDPSDATSLADVGHTLLKIGRDAEGVRALQQAVRLDPRLENERRYLDARLGQDARRGPTPVSAVEPPRGRRTLDPQSTLAEAEAAFGAGRFAEALEAIRRASDDAPASPRALIGRAGMAEFMGEFDEAQMYYAKAAALTPADPALLYRMASFAVRTGEYDRAVALLDRVRDAHSLDTRLLFRYAPAFAQPPLLAAHPALAHIVQVKIDILMEQGDLAGARRLAHGHALVKGAHAYCADARKAAHGSQEEVFRAFRLSTLGQPDAADCIWWYGQWLTDQGYVRLGRLMVLEGGRVTASETNKASAARYVRVRLGGERAVPKRAEQLFLIARQRYLRDGDRAGAVRLFEEVTRLAPDFARPFDYRARVALDEGDAPAAVAWLERGVAADPESWRTRRNLGRLLADLGRTDEAEAHLRKALELFDEDAGARLALARVLYAQKKFDEYAANTRAAVAFATAWNQPLPEVQAFLGTVERSGPGPELPPAPDPQLILGWNYD